MSDEVQPRPDDTDADGVAEPQELDGRDAATDTPQDAPAERGTPATPQRKRQYGSRQAPEVMIRQPEDIL